VLYDDAMHFFIRNSSIRNSTEYLKKQKKHVLIRPIGNILFTKDIKEIKSELFIISLRKTSHVDEI